MSCPICLETLVSATSQVVSTPCGHLFHNDCLLPALDGVRTAWREAKCPTCRAPVRLNDSSRDLPSQGDPQGNPYLALRRVYVPAADPAGDASSAGGPSTVALRAELAQARQRVRELERKENRQSQRSFEQRWEIEAQNQVLEGKQRELNRLALELAESREHAKKAEQKQKRAEQQVKDVNASLAQERAKKLALQRRMDERLREAEAKAEKAEAQVRTLTKTVAQQRAEKAASEDTMAERLRKMTLQKKSAERQVKSATESLQEERATNTVLRRKLRDKRQEIATPPAPPARPSTLVKRRPVSELVPDRRATIIGTGTGELKC